MSFRHALVAAALTALALRLAWIAYEPDTFPVADEGMWLAWGTEVLPSPEVRFSPLALRFVFHPPLYLYFVGVVHAVCGTLRAVTIAQAVLSCSLVLAVGSIARRFSGAKAGLAAAVIAACYPESVWFAAHFWAETLFTVLLWWGFERLAACDASPSRAGAAFAGLFLGLAVLTRETALYFVPLAASWLAWRRGRGGLQRALLFAGTAALTVLPWTLRNYVVFDAFVPVSTAGALNLWQGNTRASRQQVYDEYRSVHGRVTQYRLARQRAIESIRERQPWWLLEKLRDELPAFWQAHAQPIVHIERGAYGQVPRPWAYAAILVVLLPYLALLALFAVGVAVLPRSRLSLLLLGFLAYYVLIHVAAHGYPRYRLPSMPVLFVVAAHAWAVWLSGPRPRPRPRPRAALAGLLVAAVLAMSVAPSLVRWARDPWPPPWFADSVEPSGAEAP